MASETKLDLKGAQVTPIKKAASTDRTGVISSNVGGVEDEFTAFYVGTSGSAQVIQPPYSLRRLRELIDENNTLGPCVDAMEINVDSTGFVIEHESQDAAKASDLKVKKYSSFFTEVYPGQTFRTVRKQLRRDQESTGNAYLEVIRNPSGEMVFVRRVDPILVRLARLDEPVPAVKKITRGGKSQSVTMMVRERRFVQIIGVNLCYFKEYGASRDLNKSTGLWAEAGKKLPAKDRATEIIHFKCHDDVNTPYGVPRWISQSPSVMGSRKSEVFNLDFFDNGGIPPVMIFVTGGMMQKDTRKRLEQIMAGGAKSKNRGAIIEVEPTGADLNSSGSAGVKVERFGAERQQDAMFEKYDLRCEEKVRCSFRLPPLFLGKANDYTFATAYASYVVAEAQVFKPERDEFDEIINITIMLEIDPSGEYKFRSLPMSVHDIETQLKAIVVAKDFMDGEDIITSLNEISTSNFKYTKPPELVIPEATGANPLMTADGGPDSNTKDQKRPPIATDGLSPQQKLKPNSSGK